MSLEVGLRLSALELRHVSRAILEDLGSLTEDLEVDDLLPVLRRALLQVYDSLDSAASVVDDQTPAGATMYKIHGDELRAVTAIERSEIPHIVSRALSRHRNAAVDWELERTRA